MAFLLARLQLRTSRQFGLLATREFRPQTVYVRSLTNELRVGVVEFSAQTSKIGFFREHAKLRRHTKRRKLGQRAKLGRDCVVLSLQRSLGAPQAGNRGARRPNLIADLLATQAGLTQLRRTFFCECACLLHKARELIGEVVLISARGALPVKDNKLVSSLNAIAYGNMHFGDEARSRRHDVDETAFRQNNTLYVDSLRKLHPAADRSEHEHA